MYPGNAGLVDGRPELVIPEKRYVRWFRGFSISDVSLAGGKNASLDEMVRELAPLGVPALPRSSKMRSRTTRHPNR
jgi:hypothetical protein